MTIERTHPMKRKSIKSVRPGNRNEQSMEVNTCHEVCQKKSMFATTSSQIMAPVLSSPNSKMLPKNLLHRKEPHLLPARIMLPSSQWQSRIAKSSQYSSRIKDKSREGRIRRTKRAMERIMQIIRILMLRVCLKRMISRKMSSNRSIESVEKHMTNWKT